MSKIEEGGDNKTERVNVNVSREMKRWLVARAEEIGCNDVSALVKMILTGERKVVERQKRIEEAELQEKTRSAPIPNADQRSEQNVDDISSKKRGGRGR